MHLKKRETLKRSASFEGYVDSYKDGYIVGWICDLSDDSKTLSVQCKDIFGNIIAEEEANLLREDLVNNLNITNPHHGFSIYLPPSFRFNNRTIVKVIEPHSGKVLDNGEINLMTPEQDQELAIKNLNINGPYVCGILESNEQVVGEEKIKLYSDSELLNVVVTDENGYFQIYIPDRFHDGNAHLFNVRNSLDGIIDYVFDFLPLYSTPYSALEKYAAKNLPFSESPFATQRYENLVKRLNILTSSQPENITAEVQILNKIHQVLSKGYPNLKERDLFQFNLRQVENPKYSIIIPAYNQWLLSYYCIAAIHFTCNESSYEIILANDNSTDSTERLKEYIGGLSIVNNPNSAGFINNCNHAAKNAIGSYLLFINNDTEVLSNWLDEIDYIFNNFDDAGIVGGKLLNLDGSLQEAGGIIWGDGNAWNYGRNQNAKDPKYNYVRKTDYCSGALLAISKEDWDRIGGFDTNLCPAYYEDTDLAFAIKKLGKHCYYTPFAEMVHFEGLSNGTSTNAGLKKYQKINAPKFKKKWIEDFRKNPLPGDHPEFTVSRDFKYRVLVIDSECPRPDTNAGAYAAVEEMKLLRDLGCKISFLPINMAYMGDYSKQLEKLGVECLYAPFVNNVIDYITEYAKFYDFVYVTRYHVAQLIIETIRTCAPKTKILFNNADLHFLREMRDAIVENDNEKMRSAMNTRDIELQVMRDVDLTLSYNEIEHGIILSHNLDQTRVTKCPWIELPTEHCMPYENRKDIAFLGSYAHPPNKQAVLYFVSEIWPKIYEQRPDIRFKIYGSGAIDAFKYHDLGQGVDIIGYVENLDEVYQKSKLFVVPLLSGAGIKGKTLKALANGIPTIMTNISAEGIGIANGTQAIISDDINEWVNQIIDLYDNKDRWEAMSSASIKFIERTFSKERGMQLMRKALEKIEIFI